MAKFKIGDRIKIVCNDYLTCESFTKQDSGRRRKEQSESESVACKR